MSKASAHKAMKQLHDRSCFRPAHRCSLNKSERHRAMESLLFLTEKRDKTTKSQHHPNRSTQCTYMEHAELMSLTISMEGTLLTTVYQSTRRLRCHNMQHPKCICPNSCGGEGQRLKLNHHEDMGSLCGHPL